MNANSTKLSKTSRYLLHTTLLALLLGSSACHKSAPSDAPAASASAEKSPLIGQWRNMEGTWRFESWGTFWFDGGTTIQMNPSGMNIPVTKSLSGTYQTSGNNLHLTLKQHTPDQMDCTFQIDGTNVTIDGVQYYRQ